MVPFVFTFSPAMLIVTKGFTWSEFAFTVAGCVVGIVMLAAAATGFGLAKMRRWEQLLLFAGSVLVISPNTVATFLGIALAVPVILRQVAASRAAASA